MLHGTVKFCGGCNPRYDRGAAYQRIRSELDQAVSFSLPVEGQHYDILLILRGCTGCEYLYEDIVATHRMVAVCADDINRILDEIKTLTKED